LGFGGVSKTSRYGLGRIADATAIYEARHLAFDLQVAVLFHAADKVIDHGLAKREDSNALQTNVLPFRLLQAPNS
jgi:hypothetical protein